MAPEKEPSDPKSDTTSRPSTAASSSKALASTSDAASTSDLEGAKDTDAVTAELQRQRREKKPFFYCRLVTNYPLKSFFITLGLQIFLVMVSGILFLSGYDLFPTSFDTLPMELYSIPYRLRDYANRDKQLYDNKFVRELSDTGYPSWERGLRHALSSLDLYYNKDNGGNVFTKETFQLMSQIENDVISASGYSDTYCQTNGSSLTCTSPISILRYFDGTYASINAIFNDPTFSNIPAVLYEAYTNTQTRDGFQFFLPKTFTLTGTVAYGSITRSIIPIGCSLSGEYICKTMDEKVADFLVGPMKDKLEHWRESVTSFDFWYYCYVLWNKDVVAQAMRDMTLAVGSMIFIFGFMVYHTKSLWISGFAIMSIITSFLGANLIYRGIIDFQYFGFFHVLAIFIALGIGADDLFVFYDSWRLTAFHSYPTLGHRLSDAYSKSAQSMAITSLTTMVAFLCSAISPLLATKSFGVFAATTIFFNYMTVIIFFPCVVIVYHLKFEKFKWPCCRCFRKNKTKIQNDKLNNNSVEPIQDGIFIVQNGKSNGFIGADDKKGTLIIEDLDAGNKKNDHVTGQENKQTDKDQTVKKDKSKQKRLVVFFRDYYFRFVTHKIARWCLLPVFLGMVIAFSIQASKLEPDNENMQVWKDNHYYTLAVDAEQYSFLSSAAENLVTVTVLWGVKNKDRSECHFSSIDCRGDNVYDDDFNPNSVANQQALMDFCSDLYGLSASQLAHYEIKTDSSGNPEISCFTRELGDFLTNVSSILSIDLSLPWDYTKVSTLMTTESSHYDVSQFNSNFPNILEIAIQYWLYNRYTLTYTDDYGTYNDYFGEEKGTWSQPLLSNSSIFYGNKLKYIMVEINTTINRFTTGYSEGIPKVERWENFIQTHMNKMPVGLRGGFQLTENIWHWLYVQKEMEKNAVTGIAIGVSLAFPILCLSTMNFIVGSLATLSICCTTICVIGVVPSAGWKLGLLTSLNMTMLVGLAVDYVVHLAEGYRNSLHKDRLSRTRDMLEEMATSVFSGACTTLGASLFMFLSKITFFMQFGVFLFCTIGFSLFFSLGLFTVLMGLIGPQNETGSLRPLFNFLKKLFMRCPCFKKHVQVTAEKESGEESKY